MDSLRSIRTWIPFLLTALVMLLLQIGGEHSRDLFALLPQSTTLSSIHRWLMSHFVHLGWAHFSLNLAGLALLSYLLAGYIRLLEWTLFITVGAVFISFGLMYLKEDIGLSYSGFSGVLHGGFLLAASRSVFLGYARRWLLFVIIAGKVIWEQWPGYQAEDTEALIGGTVATGAHALGTIYAVLYITFQWLSKGYKNSSQVQ